MKQIRKYQLNAFRICIDTTAPDITGKAYTPLSDNPIIFYGLGEFLVKMDTIFDKEGYPQSFQDKRSFEEQKQMQNRYQGLPEYQMESEKIQKKEGKEATLDVVIYTRKNASWQGILVDLKEGRKQEFSGELDLLNKVVSYLE